jgi:hypothetical protein
VVRECERRPRAKFHRRDGPGQSSGSGENTRSSDFATWPSNPPHRALLSRKSGAARLEPAVAAYREALKDVGTPLTDLWSLSAILL